MIELHRVLVTARMFGIDCDEHWHILRDAECELAPNPFPKQRLQEEQLLGLVSDVDGVIAGEDEFTARVIRAATNLKVISKFGVGFDRINVAEATRRGVAVCNTPSCNSESVADLVVGLMLCVARQIPQVHRRVLDGEWPIVIGAELWRKTVGIIGLGAIGRAVARRLRGFQARILAYDPRLDTESARGAGVEPCDLDYLLANSDFVSINVPLERDTTKLLGAREFAMMKPTAYLINTSRGGVVDESALFECLQTGRLAGAGLDTFSHEPPGKLPPLGNLVVSSHIGASTKEAVSRMGVEAARNLVAVLRGKRPAACVNPEVFENLVRT